MKRFLLFFAALFLCVAAYAQDSDFDYVFLNNGTVVKGVIENEVENVSVTIRAVNGEVYTYKALEVRKIAHGKDPKLPEVKNSKGGHVDYTLNDTGFFFAAEAGVGVTSKVADDNMVFTEINVVGGYRVNEYFRAGIGFGGRYYATNQDARYHKNWSFPLYANFRGNFIPSEYRKVVPYYSFDIGAAIRDGFMVRPTIGIRIGEPRAAFLIGISYLGQNITMPAKKDKFISGVTLKLGYEF